MQFGPLELEACGENNFTMKALGLLSFRQDLRARLIRGYFNEGIDETEPSSIVFFSRIGEGFFREAIERESGSGAPGFEERLNAALSLPADFRWRRNADGRLTQPAKWQQRHIGDMLEANGYSNDPALHERLSYMQDWLNTEPDVVLQWGSHLALIEVKVLSGEGTQQLDRQRRLGELLSGVLGWSCQFAFVGPEHGRRPSAAGYTFITWRDVAETFKDVPDIADYINQFAFYYHGSWQSMVTRYVEQPSATAFDVFMAQPAAGLPLASPATISPSRTLTPTPDTTADEANPWHFSHLGRAYFAQLVLACRRSGHWPIRTVWTGKTGTRYAYGASPNWMVETVDGRRCTNGKRSTYNANRMWSWEFGEVADRFGLS